MPESAPANAWSVERMDDFARACALRDRRARRSYVRDDDIECAVRGYARCIAVLAGQPVVLTAADIGRAVRVYRRARNLSRRCVPGPSQPILITVADTAA